MDIKPENIMYSSFYKRAVYIDFGLSKIVNERAGFKSMTNYSGSINYWSPEMNLCYMKKKPQFVDLYYNDLHCLEASLKDLCSFSENLNIDFE
jgi:serine/threonine protein kinase